MASKKVADMCIQYVCYTCGKDLEDENSLVLCSKSLETLSLTSGNQLNCPDILRPNASTSCPCNDCLEATRKAFEDFLASTNFVCDNTE